MWEKILSIIVGKLLEFLYGKGSEALTVAVEVSKIKKEVKAKVKEIKNGDDRLERAKRMRDLLNGV